LRLNPERSGPQRKAGLDNPKKPDPPAIPRAFLWMAGANTGS
jgi:hypothetical protein